MKTYIFLLPLLLGFVLVGLSAFTAFWFGRWGERGGQLATMILRNVLGIPLWMLGLVIAWLTAAPLLVSPGTATQVLGGALIGIALVAMLWGHVTLGLRTHMPSVRDTLVRHGPYAYLRHPIYSGMLAVFAGLALLRPTSTVVLACALGIVWLVVQARLEELDLVQRLPAYREYMERVPRFMPRIWRGNEKRGK